jgi:hypothetical protein
VGCQRSVERGDCCLYKRLPLRWEWVSLFTRARYLSIQHTIDQPDQLFYPSTRSILKKPTKEKKMRPLLPLLLLLVPLTLAEKSPSPHLNPPSYLPAETNSPSQYASANSTAPRRSATAAVRTARRCWAKTISRAIAAMWRARMSCVWVSRSMCVRRGTLRFVIWGVMGPDSGVLWVVVRAGRDGKGRGSWLFFEIPFWFFEGWVGLVSG